MSQSKTADVIIIGGGVAGLSTAMQLAKRGTDVLVLERNQLGCGSTGRAAGLLGQLRGTAEATRMLMKGIDIVRELEQSADVEIYVQTGSLRIAATPDRAQEISDLVQMGRSIGLEIVDFPIEDVAARLPYMKTDDLLSACFCPTDGHLQPTELVSAYVTIGTSHGVRYELGNHVDRILVEDGQVKGVRTSEGEYSAPVVVNAAGPWSYLVAELAETVLPTAAIRHHYLIVEPDADCPVDRLSPAVRDRQLRVYSRPERGKLLVGMYGAVAIGCQMKELPSDFDMSGMEISRDDNYVMDVINAAQQRFPWVHRDRSMTVTTGIMTFTPDGKPFCGAMPNIEGLFHCSGFSGHGIVQSPAIGVIMTELILDGRSSFDIDAIYADRFFDSSDYRERQQIESKCHEMYANYYGRVERPTA